MARGSVVKRPSGSWGVRYYVNGRRRYETFATERAAERALTKRLEAIDSGTFREPSRLTLGEYATAWLEARDPSTAAPGVRTRLAPSTFAEYARVLNLHVLPRLRDRPLVSLRTDDVDGLIAELEKAGKAPGTVRNIIVPLRKLLADAVRQGHIVSNPAARADLPPAQDFVGQELPAEHSEAIRAALVELAPDDPLTGEPDLFRVWLFDVAIGTGLRLGELRALRWRDVDRDRRLVRVARAYSRGELRSPKTEAGIRSVPIFASVDVAFRGLAGRAVVRGRYGPDELVFATSRGTPLIPSHLQAKVWRRALKKAAAAVGQAIAEGAELEPWPPVPKPDHAYRFHDLRHTCVSRLVAAGADVKLVQAVAGHASPLITLQRYSHLLDGRISEAAERFDPAAVVSPVRRDDDGS